MVDAEEVHKYTGTIKHIKSARGSCSTDCIYLGFMPNKEEHAGLSVSVRYIYHDEHIRDISFKELEERVSATKGNVRAEICLDKQINAREDSYIGRGLIRFLDEVEKKEEKVAFEG